MLFVLSIPIWLSEAAVFWIVGFPFDIDDAHSRPGQMAATMILVTSITSIASSVPAAPGGLGLFEIMARETLVLSPLSVVERPVAAGFAVVVHAVQLLPMIVLGQVFLWTAQVSLRTAVPRGAKYRTIVRRNTGGDSDDGGYTRRVAVIAAGAVGLSAAYDLLEAGYKAVVHERAPFTGALVHPAGILRRHTWPSHAWK